MRASHIDLSSGRGEREDIVMNKTEVTGRNAGARRAGGVGGTEASR